LLAGGQTTNCNYYEGVFAIIPNQDMMIYPFPAEKITMRMRQVLKTENRDIDDLFVYMLEASGKMIRPRLVYLTASLYSHNPEVVRDMAVAVELIHLASLVHDDVIDNALVRRGKESINSRWGNKVSVLSGDYLFATAFNLINQHQLEQVMETITQTIKIMCIGEIKQLSMAFKTDISEEDYFEKTYKKTACLFASSCKIGALVSTMPREEVSILEQYGLYLGYAYQIIDDVLDFESDVSLIGKPVGNDLAEGNITLPIIFALNDPVYGAQLKECLSGPCITPVVMSKVLQILKDSGSLKKAVESSKSFIEAGLKLLNGLSSRPGINALRSVSSYLLSNYYQKVSHFSSIQQEANECQLLHH
jgi:heptaprenyl diphosphate synthase